MSKHTPDRNRRTVEKKLERLRVSPDTLAKQEAVLHGADDWRTQCPRCKLALKGTRNHIVGHVRACMEETNATGTGKP